MAQLNITLNQEEILDLLSKDRDEAFKKLLTDSLNILLRAESDEQIGAKSYERTEERTDFRNGYRDRELTTRIGKITLHVPRHRNVPFKTMVFDNYARSETALITTMAEMVVNGVSTRKVAKVMETLCGEGYSKSTVSEVCKKLDGEVSRFSKRPLEGGYPFVLIDATYFKVREDLRTISKAFMVAYGTNKDGRREVLGFGVYPRESVDTWTDFLTSLKKRGLNDVFMFTSDAHEGIIKAIAKVYPEAAWQRCQAHFARNISDKAPKKYQAGINSELKEMFNAKTIEEARKKRDSIISDYSDVAESAMQCLDEGFDSSMTAMFLPENLYKIYRTSNHIERLNRELKRRSKALGTFPNADSLLRLMGSVLIELNESHSKEKRVFSAETYKALIDKGIAAKLKALAEEQRLLLAA